MYSAEVASDPLSGSVHDFGPSQPAERRRMLGTLGLSAGTALVIMEANVVNVAIPSMRRELHAGAALGLWLIDVYTLVLASLLLSAGRVGDRIGARRSYLVGLSVFAGASLLCSVAGSAVGLVVARAVQGLGAALLVPAPLSLLTRMYTEPRDRAKAIALWVSIGGIGFSLGPLLGGALLAGFGWRSIFLVNIPAALVTGVLVARFVDETPRRAVTLDWRGQLVAVTGLGAVVFALIESSLTGWTSTEVVVPLTIGALALVAFVSTQRLIGRDDADVLLPPAILDSRPVRAGLFGGFAYNFALYGTLFVYTYDFQSGRHYSPLITGLAFLPLTLAATAASMVLANRFINRFGPRVGLATGMSTSAVGLLWLTAGATHLPFAALAFPGFVTFAVGMGLSAPSQTLSVMTYAPDAHKNMASSTLNAARQTGGVVGVALLGTLNSGDIATGTPIAMAVAATICLLAATMGWRLVPQRADGSVRSTG
jgi:MFS transporter, DHA2 family, methylenomycin A resistance protein